MDLLNRVQSTIADQEVFSKVLADFTYTLAQIAGTEQEEVKDIVEKIFFLLKTASDQKEAEQQVYDLLSNSFFEGKSLIERFKDAFSNRTEKVFDQISIFCMGFDSAIDYGCGNAVLAQTLHDNLGIDIHGFDVRIYKKPEVTILVSQFDGGKVPCDDDAYELGIITNVIHHEVNNEKILKELSRVVSGRLVIIETVPTGTGRELEINHEKTFMNDYLTNRLFQNSDIPTPGTFETPDDWIKRFKKYGWKLFHSESFGIDQPIIRDVHHLLVFDKN